MKKIILFFTILSLVVFSCSKMIKTCDTRIDEFESFNASDSIVKDTTIILNEYDGDIPFDETELYDSTNWLDDYGKNVKVIVKTVGDTTHYIFEPIQMKRDSSEKGESK